MSILIFCILNWAIFVSQVLRYLTTDSLFLLVILLCLLHLSWLNAYLLGLLHLMGKIMSPLICDSLLIQNKFKINPEALFQLVLVFTLDLYVSSYIYIGVFCGRCIVWSSLLTPFNNISFSQCIYATAMKKSY